MDIPKEILEEYKRVKKTYPEASVYYNSLNNKYFVALFDTWKPRSFLVSKVEVKDETATEIINRNVKIKTLNLFKNATNIHA